MNEDKLKEAVSLYKQGNKLQAAKLLGEIVRQDPNNSTAWYGLGLCLEEFDKKIYCLKKVVSLDPSHQKAQQLLEKLQSEQNLSPISIKQTVVNHSQPSTQKLPPSEKKLLFALISVLLLLVICVSIVGVTSWVKQVQVKNAQVTATAEYLQCSERFKNEMARILGEFFTQNSIGENTRRADLLVPITQLKNIRAEALNMPDKSCQITIHALLINYMDANIASHTAFYEYQDDLSTSKYIDSLEFLADLDYEVIKTFDEKGLFNILQSKGYYYWEHLDDPDWRVKVLDGH